MPEVELKFEVAAHEGARMGRSPVLAGVRPTRRRLRNIYFDTPDKALARHEMALRLRRSGSGWVQTLKAGASGGGGLHARDEWEFPQAGPRLDLSLFVDTPLAGLEGAATLHRRLRPVFEVTFVRTAWELAPAPGCRLEVALDRGTVTQGARRAEISEVEIECLEGDPAHVFELAARLLDHVRLRPSAVTKAQRGYRLLEGARLRPVKAVPVILRRDMTPLAAARAVVAAGLGQLEANAEGVVGTRDPEFVHQARVALRRMRSALRMFRKVIGVEKARAWRDELVAVGGALGEARDWDVFATEMLPAAIAAYGDASVGKALAARAGRKRRARREAAREALRSARFTRVVLELASWLALTAGDRADENPEPLPDFASRLIGKRYKRLLGGALQLGGLSVEERHRVRIDAKRLRYGVDSLASLFKSRRVGPFTRSVAALQDALGAANDAANALRLAGELAPPEAFAAFARGWFGAQARGDPQVLEPLVAELAAHRRFWRRKAAGHPSHT